MVLDDKISVKTPELPEERPAVMAEMMALVGVSDADIYTLAAESPNGENRHKVLAARRVINDPDFDRDAAREAAGLP